MKSALLLAAASALLTSAAPATAQSQAVVPIWQGPTTLSVSAEGRVERAPDVADMSAGVVTQAATASAAMTDNAQKMSRVIAALKRAGIADRDIQTAGINLNPQYRYAENRPPELVGYQASNSVNVRVRKLPDMGRVIDALVAEGSNQVNGPNFRLDKPEAALDQARVAAVRAARARADLYAGAAGLKVKRILQINEGGQMSPPPMPLMVRAQAMEKDASTPVAPGELELSTSVNVVFELE